MSLRGMNNRDAHTLLRAWGFEQLPGSGGGHDRYFWPATGQRVQLTSLGRQGKKLGGSGIGLKQAAQVAGVALQDFLAGPTDTVKVREDPDALIHKAEEQLRAAEAARIEEEQMVGPNRARSAADFASKGISEGVAAYVLAHPDQEITNNQVCQHLVDAGVAPSINKIATTVGSKLRRISDQNPNFRKVRWGVWYLTTAPEESIARTSTTPRIPSRDGMGPEPEWMQPPGLTGTWASPPSPPPLAPVAAPSVAAVLNGAMPELLSRVASLDGGRYLFQGDDGDLYMVRASKLNLTEA